MKIISLIAAGLLLAAAPAVAQIVNGGNGGNGSPVAPIGTKAGGSAASMQAPGEAAAVAGAAKNDAEWKAGQPLPNKTAVVVKRKHRAIRRHTGG